MRTENRYVTLASWPGATGRAGGSAEAQYKNLHNAWWTRMRRRVRLLMLVGVGLFILPALVVAFWLNRPIWWFDAGVFAGALACMVVGLKESPPEHIERLRTGFQGEQLTAKALRGLAPEWTVLHDLDAGPGRGNLDHVVVSPAGVFLLDSKWFVGETTVISGVVRVTRYEDADLTYVAEGLPRRMRSLARRVHDQVRSATKVSVWVTPVVVFWGQFAVGVVEDGGVTYVHGERLREWLSKQPARLPSAAMSRVTTALK
jgi:hypothetical protein